MSVVLLPMWLLSGAFFPGTESPWLRWVIALNPLTYGVAGLRRCLSNSDHAIQEVPPVFLSLAVTLVFAAACLAADIWVTRRDQAIR
jgi:ABC-type polysaccharide/polyol phosphate export permease